MECKRPSALSPTYNQVISYPKVVLYEEVEFTISTNLVQFEPGKLMTFIHLDIFYWSHHTFKRLLALWPSIRLLLPPIVFASGDVCDAKWAKLVSKFGFEPLLTDCLCSDGNIRPIYAHFRKE